MSQRMQYCTDDGEYGTLVCKTKATPTESLFIQHPCSNAESTEIVTSESLTQAHFLTSSAEGPIGLSEAARLH